VRCEVAALLKASNRAADEEMVLTPRAMWVMKLAADEARRLGVEKTGTEQVLLGLARERPGLAAAILMGFGIDAARVRRCLRRRLNNN